MTGEPPELEAIENRPTTPPASDVAGPAGAAAGTRGADGRRPGLTTFTIEGRVAPGLFVLGWLGSVLGLGIAIIAVLARGGLGGGLLFVVGLALLSGGLVAAAGSQTLERRASGVAGYAGPSPVLVFAAVLAVTVLLVVAIGSPLVAAGMDPEGPLAVLVSLAMHAFAYVALIQLLVVGTGALTWPEMGFTRLTGSIVRDLGWGGVLAVPVLFATGILVQLLSLVLPLPPEILPPAPDLAGLVANLVAAALIAPIAEELFFRGFATTAWARTAGPRAALVRGALFFAVAHVLTLSGTDAPEATGAAIFAFVARIPVGFALGWLFLRRRSIYAPIALHSVFNGLQVLALAAAGGAGAG